MGRLTLGQIPVYAPPYVAHSDDGIGVPPGTGVAPVGKMDPPELPKFSGNGVAVASMRAVLHKHRPVAANEGGARG